MRLGGGRTRKDFLRLCYELEKKKVILLEENLLRYVRVCLVSKRKWSCVTWRDHIFINCFDRYGDLLFDPSRD